MGKGASCSLVVIGSRITGVDGESLEISTDIPESESVSFKAFCFSSLGSSLGSTFRTTGSLGTLGIWEDWPKMQKIIVKTTIAIAS